MTGERALQAWLGRELATLARRWPLWWLKTHGGPFQRSGLPDVLVALGGRLVGVELKSRGEALSPRQQIEARALARAGVPVVRCETRAQCLAAIAEIAEDRDMKAMLLERCQKLKY